MLGVIEVNWMLVLGLVVMLLSAIVTLIASYKYQNSRSHKSNIRSGTNSTVDSIMSIGSLLTFIAIIPLTMYVVDIAFDRFLQQFLIGFTIISVVAGIRMVRSTIQMVALFALTVPITVIQIAISVLVYPIQKLAD